MLLSPLFNPKTVTRLCRDVNITSKQKNSAKEWIKLLEETKLEDEKKNYFRFSQIILQDILGFQIKEIDFESDNVEFQFGNERGKKMLCIEAKGTSTKDLSAPQHRAKKEHETPIKQTWDYMGSIGLDYGICTNYREFVLITKQEGYSHIHKFDFLSIKESEEEKLKEFIGVFSKFRLIEEGFVEKLSTASLIEDKDFSKEFYKLFHETRLMLIKAFQEKEQVSKQEGIHYAQLFLNRLIFMFFNEDNGNLPEHLFTKRVLNILDSVQATEYSHFVCDEIRNLFRAMDKGSKILQVFGFNGGLFKDDIPPKIYFLDMKDKVFFKDVKQNSTLSKKIKLESKVQKIIKKHNERISPIINNLLLMDSFDFTSEINVNILGHVFEQSISDLEELKDEKISRRKDEGIFYTPKHITTYICKNTIISYLSKNHASTIPELISEYSENLVELEERIKNIKILDPACGSGAFLIQAAELLLDINLEIQNLKPHEEKQSKLDKWSYEEKISKIIVNNIFGVDINEESTAITKLSLFLTMTAPNKKLADLSTNIKVGNSLIEDKIVDERAFDWNKEFFDVLKGKKFDIVIGNPPYFNIKSHDVLKDSPDFKKLSNGVVNAASLFLKRGIDLLAENGYLGFIIPKSFLIVVSWSPIRDFILENSLISVCDVSMAFEEVGLEQVIIIVRKRNEYAKTKILVNFQEINKIPQEFFIERGLILTSLDKEKFTLVKKIENDSINLGSISEMPRGITVKSSEYFNEQKSGLVQVLGGTNVERFLIKDGNKRKPNRYLKTNDIRIKQKKKKVFENERIIYQNIASSVPKIVSTLDDQQLPTDDTLNNLIITDENYPYEYVLAVLNSKLITFYLRYAIINNSKLTIHLDKPYLGRIPIKPTNKKNEIIKMVQSILKNKKIIDEKTKKFFNRLQESFHDLTISKRMESFYELKNPDFTNELEKTSGKKLKLEEKDEWEDYFEGYKAKLSNIASTTVEDLEKLDQMIFEIYNISEKESRNLY